MRAIIRFLVGLAAPFILVFGGAGLMGLGMQYKVEFLFWAGCIVVACGVLWGLWLWLLANWD